MDVVHPNPKQLAARWRISEAILDDAPCQSISPILATRVEPRQLACLGQ
jgi:hypothetical protein